MDREDPNRLAPPNSTVAQSFAADLDSMFGLGMGSGGLDTLSQTVEEKKANVSSGQSELEQLEARLRETEQRLAKVSRQNSPSRQAGAGADKAPNNDTTQQQYFTQDEKPTSKDYQAPATARPQTQRVTTQEMMAGMPGAMPGTPEQSNGRDDYVMVDRGNQR